MLVDAESKLWTSSLYILGKIAPIIVLAEAEVNTKAWKFWENFEVYHYPILLALSQEIASNYLDIINHINI
jgi:hypothetical protein